MTYITKKKRKLEGKRLVSFDRDIVSKPGKKGERWLRLNMLKSFDLLEIVCK